MTAVVGNDRDRTRRGASGPGVMDGVTYLTIYLILLFGIPSHMTITALGSLGDLSVIWGMFGLGWWTYVRLQQTSPIVSGTAPVKFALLCFFALLLVSYGALQLSGAPSETAAWADSALIRSLSWAGVALVAIDGIHDRDRYLVLVRRVVWAGALMACLGLAQFLSGESLIDTLTLPGFGTGPEYATVFDRGGFTRAAGTASHPLAYGSLLVTLLPLSIAVGVEDRTRNLLLRWGPALVLGIAALTSMSRSVLISTVLGLLLVLPAVPRRLRVPTVAAGTAMIAAVFMLVPGLFNSLRNLFIGVGEDSSTVSRTDSAGPAVDIAMRHPFFGGGFGTFMPTELILDNQILLLLIEVGVLGLVSFITLVGICGWAGWRTWRWDATRQGRSYGAGLTAGIVAGFANMFFYDALAFPLAAGLFFFMAGVSGAALGVLREEAGPAHGRRPRVL